MVRFTYFEKIIWIFKEAAAIMKELQIEEQQHVPYPDLISIVTEYEFVSL